MQEILLNRYARFEPQAGFVISQFQLKAENVMYVFDDKGYELKFQFTPFTGYLTINVDVETVYVHYNKR